MAVGLAVIAILVMITTIRLLDRLEEWTTVLVQVDTWVDM